MRNVIDEIIVGGDMRTIAAVANGEQINKAPNITLGAFFVLVLSALGLTAKTSTRGRIAKCLRSSPGQLT